MIPCQVFCLVSFFIEIQMLYEYFCRAARSIPLMFLFLLWFEVFRSIVALFTVKRLSGVKLSAIEMGKANSEEFIVYGGTIDMC